MAQSAHSMNRSWVSLGQGRRCCSRAEAIISSSTTKRGKDANVYATTATASAVWVTEWLTKCVSGWWGEGARLFDNGGHANAACRQLQPGNNYNNKSKPPLKVRSALSLSLSLTLALIVFVFLPAVFNCIPFCMLSGVCVCIFAPVLVLFLYFSETLSAYFCSK